MIVVTRADFTSEGVVNLGTVGIDCRWVFDQGLFLVSKPKTTTIYAEVVKVKVFNELFDPRMLVIRTGMRHFKPDMSASIRNNFSEYFHIF